ncbi:uncharacterized protein [Medicago truncatula]|uniref:uncharacterized protein n=1 Tax=Medicago truncatula TaxID=3880 RepID=UPI000D2F3005|nr:uncharacterized protein LOC112418461 [Medicago truncatula]
MLAYKDEVRIIFDQFHANEMLPKSMLAYFVALIPKASSPLELKDYRPIYLVGSLYKLLAKVLARRLTGVMSSVISPTQSAFLKGRNLVDGVLVVNELVDYAKITKKYCLIFKIDFEKAYDYSVDWEFLEYMMGRVVHLNLFERFRIGGNGLVVSHLQYADDTLCVGKASVENFWMMKALLRGSLPFKYLGLPVGANPKSLKTWSRWWKTPVHVEKRIVRVQREFLWGRKKISCVKWKSVCQQKKNGGMGIKDVRVMNVCLLAKWRWRLLDEENALWKDVLEEKYGPCKECLLEGGGTSWPRFTSVWC